MHWKAVCGKTGIITTRHAAIPTYQISERELVLIDSGAEKLPDLITEVEKQDLRIKAVLCTHLHPDHIANNAELVARYNTEIYASPEEILAACTPAVQYGTVRVNRRGLSRSPEYSFCPVEAPGTLKIGEAEFDVMATPGHTDGHVAYITPDGVCCVGDAIMSEHCVHYIKMPFMDDVGQAVLSMELIRQTDYPYYIAAHNGEIEQSKLSMLIDDNVNKELEFYHCLRRQIRKPTKIDQAIQEFLIAAGVARPGVRESRAMWVAARTRMKALVAAGELGMEDGMIFPITHKASS